LIFLSLSFWLGQQEAQQEIMALNGVLVNREEKLYKLIGTEPRTDGKKRVRMHLKHNNYVYK
jgi:hypothetical protein